MRKGKGARRREEGGEGGVDGGFSGEGEGRV